VLLAAYYIVVRAEWLAGILAALAAAAGGAGVLWYDLYKLMRPRRA